MLLFSVAELEWPLFSGHSLVNVELIVVDVDRIHLPGKKGCDMEGGAVSGLIQGMMN